MDWWASSQCAAAQSAACGDPNEPTPISSLPSAQNQQQQQLVDTTSVIFDPWLNCDDLDLGALLHQPAAGEPTATSDEQQQSQRALTTHPSTARLPPDNKRHIISIINNSSSTTSHHHRPQQQQQQQHNLHHQQEHLHEFDLHQNNQNHLSLQHPNLISSQSDNLQHHHNQSQRTSRPSANSTAASPLSSSLGSSPPTTNNQACFLSSPPHSSNSPQSLNPNSVGFRHLIQDSNNNNNNTHERSSYFSECFVAIDQQHHQGRFHHDLLQAGAGYECPTSYGEGEHPAVAVVPGEQHQNQPAQRTQQRSSKSTGGCGSSLLTNGSSALVAPRTSAVGHCKPRPGNRTKQGAPPKLGANGQKLRRCRHITDFVLADEEKRLLLKEGYTDFPMSCQMRPLTKSEERVLRKIRRKIRNKKSAQCSRQRKKEYVEELERKYSAVLRENDELRRLLATGGGVKLDSYNNYNDHRVCNQTNQVANSSEEIFLSPLNEGGGNESTGSGGTIGQDSTSGEADQICWKNLCPQTNGEHEQRVGKQQPGTGGVVYG